MKKNKKLLYIDVPFMNEKGGDKNRSRFLWNTLQANYDCDLLLINHFRKDSKIAKHNGYNELFQLRTTQKSLFQSHSYFNFSKNEIANFAGILQKHNYDIIFIRFASPAFLTPTIEKVLPQAKIVLDIDMLFSRLSKLAWQANPTLKNRYFLLEFIRQRNYEFELFARPYLFFFSNVVEKKLVEKIYINPSFKGKLQVIPNVMHPVTAQNSFPKKNYILFYGDLGSTANLDAFEFLVKKIYPLVSAKLKQKKAIINVVGKNKQALSNVIKEHHNLENIEVVGEVDDINIWIGAARFVLLPIRIASGTRTRILEAAATKTPVITTSIGVEGFEFNDREIVIADTAETISQNIISLLEDSEKCKKIGEKFHEKAKKLYLDSIIAQKMINNIEKF
jgi:glycosyltransferase involved in cell wall biosynthesis